LSTDYIRDILESKYPPLVHVGYPKALSTWLQGPLFCPPNGFMRAMGAVAAGMALVNPSPLKFDERVVRNQLIATRRRQGSFRKVVPVVSLEDLVGNRVTGGHDAKLLADRLAMCFDTARILIIVREQQSMLRSLYENLVIGRGYPRSVASFLDPVSPTDVPQISPEFLRYDDLTAYYRQCFGPERVLVLPYEFFLEAPRAFVSRIGSFAGGAAEHMDLDQIATERVVNAGRGLTAVIALRLINKWVFKSPLDPRGIMRLDSRGLYRWRTRIIDKIDGLAPDTLDRWLEQRFARYAAGQTAGRFRASNRRLAEMMDMDLARYGYEM